MKASHPYLKKKKKLSSQISEIEISLVCRVRRLLCNLKGSARQGVKIDQLSLFLCDYLVPSLKFDDVRIVIT